MQRPEPIHRILRRACRLALAALLLNPAAMAAPDPTVDAQNPPPGLRHGGDGVGGIEKKSPTQPGSPNGKGTPPGGGATFAATEAVDEGGTWSDVGGELPGTGTPRMQAVGGLAPGDPLTLLTTDARPQAPAALVLGTGIADVPFKGGTLVPRLDLVLTGLTIDAQGELSLQATMPDVLPAGVTLCLQLWTLDPLGPQGFAASNALVYTSL